MHDLYIIRLNSIAFDSFGFGLDLRKFSMARMIRVATKLFQLHWGSPFNLNLTKHFIKLSKMS